MTTAKIRQKTATHFDDIYPSLRLTQPLISTWLKHKSKWQEQYKASTTLSHSAKRFCQIQYSEISEMLDLWISKVMADNVLIIGKVLHQKWKKFANLHGVPDDEYLTLSEGWLTKLKLCTKWPEGDQMTWQSSFSIHWNCRKGIEVPPWAHCKGWI